MAAHPSRRLTTILLAATATAALGLGIPRTGVRAAAAAAIPSPPAAPSPAPAPTPTPAPAKSADKNAAKPQKVTEDPEVREGREAYEDMLRSGIKLVRDPQVLSRVETIGKKLAAIADTTAIPAKYGSDKLVPYEYHFYVVDDPDVNAFSLPGGYIFINKGLLNTVQSDDELAGVIGHEITHAAHHHVSKLEKEQSKANLTMAAGLLAAIFAHVPTQDMMNAMTGLQLVAIQKVNGYSQQAERDADNGGIVLMQKAGYNPVGMLTFMERLAREERSRPDIEQGIFRTHPPSKERADAAVAEIKAMGLPINRREVTNELKVAVRKVAVSGQADTTASEVTLDGKVFYRSPSDQRCKEAADALNSALDQSLQLYDVQRKGNVVLVRGKMLVMAMPEDALLAGGTATPDTVADQAYRTLRMALYRDLLENGN